MEKANKNSSSEKYKYSSDRALKVEVSLEQENSDNHFTKGPPSKAFLERSVRNNIALHTRKFSSTKKP